MPCDDGGKPFLAHLLALVNALIADGAGLALENIALRQQIVVLEL